MKKEYKIKRYSILLSLVLVFFLFGCESDTMPSITEEYNLTLTGGNTTGIVSLVQSVNTNLMFNLFGTMLLLTIFVILLLGFVVSNGGSGVKALLPSSFITTMISLIFMGLKLIPPIIFYGCLVLVAISIVLPKE